MKIRKDNRVPAGSFLHLGDSEILTVFFPQARVLLEGRATQEPLKQQVKQNGPPGRHEAGAHHHHGSVVANHLHGLVFVIGAVDIVTLAAVAEAGNDGADDVYDEAAYHGHKHHEPRPAPAALHYHGRPIGDLVRPGVFSFTHLEMCRRVGLARLLLYPESLAFICCHARIQ